MLSKKYYINEPTNNVKWRLKEKKSHAFERIIFDSLSEQLESKLLDEDVTIIQTPGSRDDGKDIIIESCCDLKNIFYHDFYLMENSKIKIYIECKSSDNRNLAYDSILSKVSKVKEDGIQYYLLVTNSTITPFSFYQLVEEFSQYNVQFYLIDQTLLAKYFNEIKTKDLILPNVNLSEKLYAEYQVLEKFKEKTYNIYLFLRNYSSNNIVAYLHLLSDWNWETVPREQKIIISPWGYKIILIEATQKYNDGIEELNFNLSSKNNEVVFSVKGIHSRLHFQPSLCGKQHKLIKNTVVKAILKGDFGGIKYIFGEAGTGKTRLIEEITDSLNGKNVEIMYSICNNDIQTKKKLLSFLFDKKLISIKGYSKELSSYFTGVNCTSKKHLIILDDIHNLNTLLDELKQLNFSKIPKNLCILLIGRNDYSIGSVKYYNFIQFCNYTDIIKGYTLNCLDEEDTTIFIKSIIKDLPEIIFKKIKEASNNNPLFIIQFIEYLLDIDIAHLINKEAVGIANIEKFTSNVYIPTKIEELYENRRLNLFLNNNGNNIQNLLMILAYINKPLPYNAFETVLHIEQSEVNELLVRKLIKFTDYKKREIWFSHESIYLFYNEYFKKEDPLKLRCSNIILNDSFLLSKLSDFRIGELYFNIGEYEKAKKYFLPIISFCETIDNYTTCSTDINFLPFLDIVFYIMHNTGNDRLLDNCLIYKIYTTLHYFTPVHAIEVCNEIENKIKKISCLRNNNKLINTISTLKSHSYVNSGQLVNAESGYQKLICNFIMKPADFDRKTAFDMFDRLAGLYIRYNNFGVAKNYNALSKKYALSINDVTLLGLVEITKAKMFFYNDTNKSLIHLNNAKLYLDSGEAHRNQLHNNITIAAYQVLYTLNDVNALEKHFETVYAYLRDAISMQYPGLIIRSYLLLGIIDLKCDKYDSSINFINKGIDASIQYGLPSYIWMLFNIKFILSVKQKKDIEYQDKLVEIIYFLLKKQNLLFLGCRDYTYGNIPVITNIARFYTIHKFESEFYKKFSCITFLNRSTNFEMYNTISKKSIVNTERDRLKDEYQRVQKGKLLYMDENIIYDALDNETGYFIVFA